MAKIGIHNGYWVGTDYSHMFDSMTQKLGQMSMNWTPGQFTRKVARNFWIFASVPRI